MKFFVILRLIYMSANYNRYGIMKDNLPYEVDCAFAITPPPIQFTDNQLFTTFGKLVLSIVSSWFVVIFIDKKSHF